jgi:D-threonate/D-erythronate kinase
MSHRKLDVVIIADDLTGALDTAAPFAALGFKTAVRLDVDRAPSTIGDSIQVLSLTTESRHLPPHAAEERIRLATGVALVYQPRILLKKIDSTLRGNVAIEILASLRWSGRRHAMVAPAVPSQGRIMRGGEVFIDDVALRQTQFASDALSPPPVLPLPEVLSAASTALNVHSWPRGAAFHLSIDAGLHAYIADCQTDEDLDAIAKFASSHCNKVLPVGASGLGAALARQLAVELPSKTPSSAVSDVGQHAQRPILFVIGSRAAMSVEQMARLREAGAAELAMPLSASQGEAEEFLDRSIRWVAPPVALIVRPESSETTVQIRASEVAHRLGRVMASLVRRLKINVVVMVGGDTAFEIFQALAIREAVISGELLPGIAIGMMQVDAHPLTFITKAGGYGDADVLTRILQRLQNL